MDFYYLFYSFAVLLCHSFFAVLLVVSLFWPISNDQEHGNETGPARGFKSNLETKRNTGSASKIQLVDGSSNRKQKPLIALQADQEQGGRTKSKHGCESNPETKWKTGFVSKTQLVDEPSKPEEERLILLQEISAESCGSRKSCELSGSAEEIEFVGRCDRKKCEIVDSTEKVVSDEHGNNAVSSAVDQCPESLIDLRLISVSYEETEMDLAKEEVGLEKVESLHSEITEEADCRKDEELLDEDDDEWEGIERTELHTCFDSAVAYVGSKANSYEKSKLGSDLKLQLYGLHKIAMEGPCQTPQPMAFKLSARAKWNAWQKLGNMKPEDAMEQYMNLVTTLFPEWMMLE